MYGERDYIIIYVEGLSYKIKKMTCI